MQVNPGRRSAPTAGAPRRPVRVTTARTMYSLWCELALAIGIVPGNPSEGIDDEGDELFAWCRLDLVEPSQ